ncbi:XRE family transcriptional regulator [Siphonobacter aquaeclarae]|uniref:Helix-turn-helix domain-containing protein n=1 Tax=Siphonobacter aquaeclarae TaxID=563176 RepID=A0A1G9JYL5_9BACT|nr:LexA family transcriptional regulator [Siphonobacter aquaeclarae]SDL42611.1 Helix-turn-helix domain-containing protein [Siphonobacter aquaeclarae]
MKGATLFFHSNLRFLRERKKMTQEDLSAVLELSRNKLQALESGKTKNPAAEDLLGFSDYFGVSVDTLLRVDLMRLGELQLRELMAGNDAYRTGSQIRVLAITVDRQNNENLEYVPVKAKAGYRDGYADPEFLASLPRYALPNLPDGTFRMFPISGDSMLPVPDGSDVTASYIEDWTRLRPDTPCIVILRGEQDFVFKLVTIQEQELLLKSLNTAYEPYRVPVGEVLEIWQFYSYQTRDFPEAASDLQALTRAVRGIQEEMRDLRGKRFSENG